MLEKVDEPDLEDSLSQFLRIPGADPTVVDDDRRHVWEQIKAKKWDDLGVLEVGDRLLFPWQIWRRDRSTGKFVGDPCLLQLPRGPELRAARIESRIMAKAEGLDLTLDSDQVEDLESLCDLWLSIRDTSDPYEPKFGYPKDLEKKYDRVSLEQVNFALKHLKRLLDPKVSGMGADEMAAISAAIVERQSIDPLAAYDGATQATYVITLASVHKLLLEARSSGGPSAH